MSKRIRYIGKKPRKEDNVASSNFVWEHPGQVKEVSDEVAIRLLNYPSVWVEEGAANDPGANAKYERITGTKESTIIQNGETVDGTGEVVEPEKVKPVENAAGFAFSNDPSEAVEQAIRMLDPDNDDHFTGQGIPRVGAIEALLGYPIKAEARNAAWEKLVNETPTSLDEMIGKPTEEQLVQ